jgi:hypothetical protein
MSYLIQPRKPIKCARIPRAWPAGPLFTDTSQARLGNQQTNDALVLLFRNHVSAPVSPVLISTTTAQCPPLLYASTLLARPPQGTWPSIERLRARSVVHHVDRQPSSIPCGRAAPSCVLRLFWLLSGSETKGPDQAHAEAASGGARRCLSCNAQTPEAARLSVLPRPYREPETRESARLVHILARLSSALINF